MVFICSVIIDDSVMAGIGTDDFIRNELLPGFVGFDLIKFGEVGVVVPLIVNIVASKLHGNGCLTVQAFAVASIRFAAVNTIGMYDIAESFATSWECLSGADAEKDAGWVCCVCDHPYGR